MRKKSNAISMLAFVIGALLLTLANVGAIGLLIYQWAVVDILFKVALWSAFKLWLTMLVGGVCLLFTSILLR